MNIKSDNNPTVAIPLIIFFPKKKIKLKGLGDEV